MGCSLLRWLFGYCKGCLRCRGWIFGCCSWVGAVWDAFLVCCRCSLKLNMLSEVHVGVNHFKYLYLILNRSNVWKIQIQILMYYPKDHTLGLLWAQSFPNNEMLVPLCPQPRNGLPPKPGNQILPTTISDSTSSSKWVLVMLVTTFLTLCVRLWPYKS